jgi:hypothetical protein
VKGVGFRVYGLGSGFMVDGLWCGVYGLRLRVQGSGLGLWLRVQGSKFMVYALEFRV